MAEWDCYGYEKKRAGTHYAELVFLHPVGSAGHVVHFGVFEARNVDPLFSRSGAPSAISIKGALGHITLNLCFCIWWDIRGHVVHCGAFGARNVDTIFSCSGWTGCNSHFYRNKILSTLECI
jgi:hypothetical protein